MSQIDGLIYLGVSIDCICELGFFLFLFFFFFVFWFVLCLNVTYYRTALSAVFEWICALQVFIIIIMVDS